MLCAMRVSRLMRSACTELAAQSISSSFGRTSVRFRRNVFHRRPFKVLTNTGEDYDSGYGYAERVSQTRDEVSVDEMKKHEPVDRYFDEGFGIVDEHRSDHQIQRKFNRSVRERLKMSRVDSQDKKVTEGNVESVESGGRKPDKQTDKQDLSPKTKTKKKEAKSEKELKPRIAGIPVYEKLGENNREFMNTMKEIKMRNRREKSGSILLEGKRLICDAIDAGVAFKVIYFSKEENLVGIKNLNELIKSGVHLKKVFYKDLSLFTETEVSPGVMAVCRRPSIKAILENPLYRDEPKMPLMLICDNVRDPGNLGTLIRSAAGVGIEKIILMKGCVDSWEPKVVRAGAGAHFRIPIVQDIEWPLISLQLPADTPFEMFIAESSSDANSSMKTINRDENINSFNFREDLIKSYDYSDVNFFRRDSVRYKVLVIGGETFGVSNESYKLANEHNGSRVGIPLAFGVESLNSAVAATVIMYEMRRQYLVHLNDQIDDAVIN